jgi:hypothetical protein
MVSVSVLILIFFVMYICHRPEKCWKEALDLYKKLLDKQLLLLNLNVNG